MEQWRSVVGREGLHEVSDQGQIRSVRTGKLLKPWPRPPRGYPTVKFGHRGRSISVHTLVLEAFVGPCPEGMECLHEDDDAQNNQLSNLRWGTRTENLRDRVRNGTHNHAKKTRCKREHDFTPENTYLKKDGARQCKQCVRDARRARGYVPRAR